jgi:DNA (cytosine-5)-methyltransferase 1
VVAFTQNSRSEVREIGGDGQIVGALAAEPGAQQQNYVAGTAVRRLTPRECERLQSFPDDYTDIPWNGKKAPDGPRYKALGNSMNGKVMRWIGERMDAVKEILRGTK